MIFTQTSFFAGPSKKPKCLSVKVRTEKNHNTVLQYIVTSASFHTFNDERLHLCFSMFEL